MVTDAPAEDAEMEFSSSFGPGNYQPCEAIPLVVVAAGPEAGTRLQISRVHSVVVTAPGPEVRPGIRNVARSKHAGTTIRPNWTMLDHVGRPTSAAVATDQL